MTNSPTKLMRVLQQLFRQQARDAVGRTNLRGDQDFSGWAEPMADIIQPLMLQMFQQGMIQAAARIGAKVGGEVTARGTSVTMPRSPIPPEPKPWPTIDLQGGMRRVEPGNDSIFGSRSKSLVLKGKRRVVLKAARVDASFDLFNPRVMEAVRRATLVLCQETLDTATREVNQAIRDLRQLLADGLPQGDAAALLAKKVRQIFADPYRAFRIATTEGSRAIHGGQMLAAAEVGVEKHSWLASSDACDQCLDLDGKVVNLGEPFVILPGGGPYSVVLHPPLHPHCFCTTTEEL